MKYVVFMSRWPRTIKILVSNWPRTRKFTQLFKITGVGDLFLPWLRSMSHFYALIGHNLIGEFMFMQHLETCLLRPLKLTEFCVNFVMFLTVFFYWMYKMSYSCFQESSVIHGWFVFWVFGWEMRRLSKLEIRFRVASFSFFTLLNA